MHRYVLIFCLVMGACCSAAADDEFFFHSLKQSEDVKVDRVIQINNIHLQNHEKVRLIGVRAYEVRRRPAQLDKNGYIIEEEVKPETPVQELALTAVTKMLEGQKVRIEYDEQLRDDDGVLMVYMFLKDGTFVNAEILRQGYADLTIRPPNIKYEDKLRAAYQEARREKRGLQGE